MLGIAQGHIVFKAPAYPQNGISNKHHTAEQWGDGEVLEFLVIWCYLNVWCVMGDFMKGHGSTAHALTHLHCKGRKDPSGYPWKQTWPHLSSGLSEGDRGDSCVTLICKS